MEHQFTAGLKTWLSELTAGTAENLRVPYSSRNIGLYSVFISLFEATEGG